MKQGWKPVLIPTSYDGLEDNEEVKMVSKYNESNNNYYKVGYYKSDEEAKDIFFEEQVDDKIKVTPKTTLNPKVVHAMKNLQALYNNHANKIVKQAAQEI